GPYFRNGNCRTPLTVSHYEQVESGREPNRIVYRFVAEQVVRITSAAKAPKGDFLQQKLQSLKAHIPDLRV
ncbi:MAG TPA: hypothetical protein VFR09_05240, partial [Alphaproteobacteria bacterium]|nr:hypothetical protein [Alphaproteobacteria bacterium]